MTDQPAGGRGAGQGEDASDAGEQSLDEVQRRLAEIQNRKRGRIRWNVSKHTAELAIGALSGEAEPERRSSSKSRRRKRRKRLL